MKGSNREERKDRRDRTKTMKLERDSKALQTVLKLGVKTPFAILENFPNGCCKISSMVLTEYLISSGSIPKEKIFLVANGKKDGLSHAWLIVDEKIVDLTAYQFDEKINAVIFPSDSDFHLQFKETQHYPYDGFISNLSLEAKKDLEKTLEIIVGFL
jgi:hypothetical protein